MAQGKFHIDINGKPAPCTAKQNCPRGGDNEHFNSVEEAQNYSDNLNERNLLISQYKEKPLLKTLIKINAINKSLNKDPKDGIYTQEEAEKIQNQEKEKAKLLENQKKIEEENYRKFLNLEHIEMPEYLKLNDVLPLEYYSKIRLSKPIYRGENIDNSKGNNTNIAMFGQGLYSTTNQEMAKGYGKVRKLSLDETPAIPLVLKDDLSFNQVISETCKKYGFSKSMLTEDASVIIRKMGYDGVAFGDKNNMIIVNYFEEGSNKNPRKSNIIQLSNYQNLDPDDIPLNIKKAPIEQQRTRRPYPYNKEENISNPIKVKVSPNGLLRQNYVKKILSDENTKITVISEYSDDYARDAETNFNQGRIADRKFIYELVTEAGFKYSMRPNEDGTIRMTHYGDSYLVENPYLKIEK